MSDRPTSCRNSLIRTLAKCWVREISGQHPVSLVGNVLSLHSEWKHKEQQRQVTRQSPHLPHLPMCLHLGLVLGHATVKPHSSVRATPHSPFTITPSLTPQDELFLLRWPLKRVWLQRKWWQEGVVLEHVTAPEERALQLGGHTRVQQSGKGLGRPRGKEVVKAVCCY